MVNGIYATSADGRKFLTPTARHKRLVDMGIDIHGVSDSQTAFAEKAVYSAVAFRGRRDDGKGGHVSPFFDVVSTFRALLQSRYGDDARCTGGALRDVTARFVAESAPGSVHDSVAVIRGAQLVSDARVVLDHYMPQEGAPGYKDRDRGERYSSDDYRRFDAGLCEWLVRVGRGEEVDVA